MGSSESEELAMNITITDSIEDEIRGLFEDSDQLYQESIALRAAAKFQTGADKEMTLQKATESEELAVKWVGDALELQLTL